MAAGGAKNRASRWLRGTAAAVGGVVLVVAGVAVGGVAAPVAAPGPIHGCVNL